MFHASALVVCVLSAIAGDLPTEPVNLQVTAYGELLEGFIVVDADALAAHGVVLWRGETKLSGSKIPLAIGMTVVTEKHGRKRFGDVIDGLMLFDSTGEGYLDAKDPTFAAISLFVDADADTLIDDGELKSLKEIGIETITRYGDVRMAERWTTEGPKPVTP